MAHLDELPNGRGSNGNGGSGASSLPHPAGPKACYTARVRPLIQPLIWPLNWKAEARSSRTGFR